MTTVKTESDLEELARVPVEMRSPADSPTGQSIPPLRMAGLVILKVDLIRALRVYVPQLSDVTALDGDAFMLRVTAAIPDNDGRP